MKIFLQLPNKKRHVRAVTLTDYALHNVIPHEHVALRLAVRLAVNLRDRLVHNTPLALNTDKDNYLTIKDMSRVSTGKLYSITFIRSGVPSWGSHDRIALWWYYGECFVFAFGDKLSHEVETKVRSCVATLGIGVYTEFVMPILPVLSFRKKSYNFKDYYLRMLGGAL